MGLVNSVSELSALCGPSSGHFRRDWSGSEARFASGTRGRSRFRKRLHFL